MVLPSSMIYLLDSNAFIESQRRHYAPDICPGYWDWLNWCCTQGEIRSIKAVLDELTRSTEHKDDYSYQWAKTNNSFFLDDKGKAEQTHFGSIVKRVSEMERGDSVKRKFLDPSSADVWLIAKALTYGSNQAVIVTNEDHVQDKKKIRIPEVCKLMGGIECIPPYQLLRITQRKLTLQL